MFSLYWICSLLCSLLVSTSTAHCSESSDVEAALDAYITKAVESKVFSGVIIIGKGDEMLLCKGYGFANFELAVPMSTDAVFRVASVTKTFTAAAVLILRDAGKLKLDDTLDKYVPELPWASKVTLEQIGTHTAGIPQIYSPKEIIRNERQPMSREEFLNKLAQKAKLDFQPGTNTKYSNAGYNILALVVERVSKMNYGEFLKKEIFAPLGMDSSLLGHPDLFVQNMTANYRPGPPPHNLYNAYYVDPTNNFGSAALYTSASDMFTWARAIVQGRLGDHLGNIKDKKSWGFRYDPDEDMITITGTWPGSWATITTFLADAITVVIAGNIENFGSLPQIRSAIYKIARGEAVEPLDVEEYGYSNPALFENDLGYYSGSPFGDFTIRKDKFGNLELFFHDFGFIFYMRPIDGDTLALPSWGHLLKLKRDASGKTTGCIYSAWGKDTLCKRAN